MSFLCCLDKWHPNKPLVFTSVRIMALGLPWDSWSVGAAGAHTLVTVKCDIAYSVYIAQMFLIHCQPAAALQLNYHYKGALLFWFLGLFLADTGWPFPLHICTSRTKKEKRLKVQNKFQKSWVQISRAVPEGEDCAAHLGCAVAAEFMLMRCFPGDQYRVHPSNWKGNTPLCEFLRLLRNAWPLSSGNL